MNNNNARNYRGFVLPISIALAVCFCSVHMIAQNSTSSAQQLSADDQNQGMQQSAKPHEYRGACPHDSFPAYVQSTRRSEVKGGYLVIEYNADSTDTSWFDYQSADRFQRVVRNGSFLPVVYTKEKIAVHVCDLHFGDLLTVTTSPFGLPEGGADIHGTTAAAIPALTSTLDTLQSGAATGGTAPVSSVGFGATTALGSITVSGVTLGTMTYDGKSASYTDANVTISGEQFAIMLFALDKNVKELIRAVKGNIAGWMREHHPEDKPEPASVAYVLKASQDLKDTIQSHISDLHDAAKFDTDVSAVQNFSVQLNTLANSLSTQGLGARAITLQTNYATLRGILDFVRQELNCSPSNVYGAATAGTHVDQVYPCHEFEQSKFKAFDDMYKQKIKELMKWQGCEPKDFESYSAFSREACPIASEPNNLAEKGAGDFESDVASDQYEMFHVLGSLGHKLKQIDTNASAIFNDMNDWNTKSRVEQTDLISPSSGNALMRISIVVQRGYTPFVLANTPSGAPPAPAAPAVATAPSAASTSTPPHAVKTVLVEVHRLANFNLAGGMVLIHVPTKTYSVVAAPAPAVAGAGTPTTYTGTCNGATVNVPPPPPPASGQPTPPNYACVVATQKTNWQVAGMAGITWYPWGRDYFPRHSGVGIYRRNLMPSLLLGTSVTSLGNAVGAVNWEPIGGIDLFAGIGTAHRTVLPSGVTTTTALPTSYALQTVTQQHVGFATGIAFDLGVFIQLFQKTAPAGMP